jgi:CheY-like chemotaxis protein
MLAYAGKANFEFRAVDLPQVIRDTRRLIQASVPKHVTPAMNFATDCKAIQADPTQLRQVAMNLIINGAEAIGASAGTVTVDVQGHVLDAPPAGAVYVSPNFRAGAFVMLSVADTGCGIPADQLQRVFEPFYSTKFTGRGLGLSAVHGIIGSHGGALEVTSTPGGTTFRAYFPATAIHAASIESRHPPALSPAADPKGTILVVDDEDAIRRVVVRALSRVGFACVTASEGREAVQLFQAAPARFRLVVVDLTMPIMDGKATMRAMREAHPGVRFVVMSGLASADALAQCGDEVVERFVEKPFDARAMVDAVCGALEGTLSVEPPPLAQPLEIP